MSFSFFPLSATAARAADPLSSTLLTGGGPTTERTIGMSISPMSREETMVPKMSLKKVRIMTDLGKDGR